MNKKKNSIYFFLIVLSFSVAWILSTIFPEVVDVWNLKTTDQLFQLRYSIYGKRPVSPYVIHVDYDDTSIATLQHSTSDRILYKKIISALSAASVDKIALDMIFPNCPIKEECLALTNVVKKAGNVFLPVILKPIQQQEHIEKQQRLILNNSRALPRFWDLGLQTEQTLVDNKIAFASFTELNQAALGLGHITCYPDQDGIFRRFPLLLKNQGLFVPSLPLAVVSSYLNVSPENIRVKLGKEIILLNAHYPDGRIKDITIPIDKEAKALIHFAGPWNDSFAHYSVIELLRMGEDEDLKEQLLDEIEGDIAIVSDVSTFSRDVGPIPLENFYPLSGLHANLISSILEEDLLTLAQFKYEAAIVMIMIIFLYIASTRLSGTGFTLTSIIVCALFFCYTAGILFFKNVVTYPMVPFFGQFLSFLTVVTYKYLLIAEEKAFIRARFENYFAPPLLKKILKSPDTLNSCEKKVITVLFSDIVGFTAWSSTQEAEDIHKALNEYFDEMAQIVFRFGGTIDKYIGDGMLAFFGDPVEYPDHSARAVQAAIEMQKTVLILRKKWQKVGGMPLKIRVGINTGEVVVGNLGSNKRVEYTVIGAHVNLAQRLESSAPAGGILVSKSVHEIITPNIPTSSFGNIKLKGFSDELEVFEVEVCK